MKKKLSSIMKILLPVMEKDWAGQLTPKKDP